MSPWHMLQFDPSKFSKADLTTTDSRSDRKTTFQALQVHGPSPSCIFLPEYLQLQSLKCPLLKCFTWGVEPALAVVSILAGRTVHRVRIIIVVDSVKRIC